MAKIKNGKIILLTLIVLLASLYSIITKAQINIVAAENVYGEVAKELGGPYVNVTSILNDPNQDPHLFTVSVNTAKAVNNADIIIYNGADYDTWMKPLLAINSQKPRQVIMVSQLMNIKPGSNPHIWYQPKTMPVFAQNLTLTLSKLDPNHQAYFAQQLNSFMKSYQKIFQTINFLKQNYQNTPVIATEPIFNDMAESIGLQMHGKDFQINIMNDVPPSISQIKQFENDLRQHAVRVLIYNNQVNNPLTRRMQSIAQAEKIPVVGISEMLPKNMTYVQWMLTQLQDLEKALT
jgi:zinc/manganese transport system substrate-binding protein